MMVSSWTDMILRDCLFSTSFQVTGQSPYGIAYSFRIVICQNTGIFQCGTGILSRKFCLIYLSTVSNKSNILCKFVHVGHAVVLATCFQKSKVGLTL